MKVLLDSDVLIEVMRGRKKELVARWVQLADSGASLLCSPVTVAELWRGARPGDTEQLEDLFAALTCVPISEETGRRAGDYLRQYARSHGMELGDALIAAGASIHDAALWTGNRKHFPMKNLTFY
jgi:predicted nucleic acid-binding protein